MIIPGMFSSGRFGIIPDPPEPTECFGYWDNPDRFDKDDCKYCTEYAECLSDAVSRQDAEAIFRNARIALMEQDRKEHIKDFETRELMLLNAEQFIHLLPPVEPKRQDAIPKSVIDDIRAEIAEIKQLMTEQNSEPSFIRGLEQAVNVIDAHIKAVEDAV